MQVSPRIAIIGGGPGGLTMARILHVNGVEATVFESDSAPDARGQGGSLDLHTESGLMALAAAGLMPEFDKVARPEDQGVRLYDKDGTCVFDDGDEVHDGRPEIDRGQLRALLLRSLPDRTVRWNSKVRAVEPAGNAWEVQLDGGAGGVFDLVVGADGAWSRVRPLLSDEKPAHTGVTFVELNIDGADRRHPALSAMVGPGKIFALADGKALIAQRNSAGIHVYLALGEVEIDLSQPVEARRQLVAQLPDWSPKLLAFIHAVGDTMAVRAIHAFPVGFRWDHRSGVTLIGDAAHVMSPFAGEGVNNAMLDAAELAKAVLQPDWRTAVQTFEEAMFARIPESAAQSAYAMEQFLAPDGLANAIAIFNSFAIETQA